MKNFKKLLACVLTILLLLTSLPLTVFTALAEPIEDIEYGVTYEVVGKGTYHFTPDEDGMYCFFSSGDSDPRGELSSDQGDTIEEDDDSGVNNNFDFMVSLKKGETYTFYTYELNDAESARFFFQIDKINFTELDLGVSLNASGRGYFSYTPTETGLYSFQGSPFETSIVGRVVQSDDFYEHGEDTDAEDGFNIDCVLIKGETYYCITSAYDYTVTPEYIIQIKSIASKQTLLADTSVETTGQNFFEFTPTSDGAYRFYSVYAENYELDTEAALFLSTGEKLSYNDQGGDGYGDNFLIIQELSADNTYYLWSRNYSAEDIGIPYIVKVEKMPSATEMVLNPNPITVHPGLHQRFKIDVMPEGAAPEYMSECIVADESIATINTDGDVFGVKLGTTNATVTSENGLTETLTINVVPIPEIKLGSTAIKFNTGLERYYYKFIPEESKRYTIYSKSDIDTGIEIQTEDFFYLASDDSGGVDENFRLTYDFIAGTPYLFDIYTYSAVGNVEIVFEEENVVTDIEVVSYPSNNTYVEGAIPEYAQDLVGLKLKFTWTDGSVTYWEYGDSTFVEYTYMNIDSYLADDNMITITLGDATVDIKIDVVPNPLASIEVIETGIEPLVFEVDGVWDIRENENEEEEEFFLYQINYYNFKFKINYSDGTFEYAHYGETILGSELMGYNDQYASPWTLGGENTITFELLGKTVTYNMPIIENPVKSIEVLRVSPIIENTRGGIVNCYDPETDTYFDVFVYYNDALEYDVKITYTDGTTHTEKNAWGQTYIKGKWMEIVSDQESEPWTIGGENYATFTYMGKSHDYKVDIIPTPVKSIEVIDKNFTPLEENVHGYWDQLTDDQIPDTNSNFIYDLDYSKFGIKITYNDGTVKTVDNVEDSIDGHWVQIYHNQEDKHWTVGGDENIATFEYLGVSTEYNVEIISNPVTGIEITKPPKNEFFRGDAEYFEYYGDEFYFCPDDFSGMEILVTFADGSQKTVTVSNKNQRYLDGYHLVEYTPEYSNDMETMPVTIRYRGYMDSYDITFKDSGVKDIEVVSAPKLPIMQTNMFVPDLSGTVIKITYQDGSEKTITLSQQNTTYEYTGRYDSQVAAFVEVDGQRILISFTGEGYADIIFMGCQKNHKFTSVNSEEIFVTVNKFNPDGNINITVDFKDGTSKTYDVTPVSKRDDSSEQYFVNFYYVSKTEDGYISYNIYKENSSDNYIIYILTASFSCVASGDVNFDGLTDLNDVVVTAQHVAGWNVDYNDETIDVNGDDAIDLNDVVLLAQFVAGWDVEIKGGSNSGECRGMGE